MSNNIGTGTLISMDIGIDIIAITRIIITTVLQSVIFLYSFYATVIEIIMLAVKSSIKAKMIAILMLMAVMIITAATEIIIIRITLITIKKISDNYNENNTDEK